ncbi:SDR family oxidoreductase [Pseudonocardia petroleophila]|uniref:SDR family oxidoreductase n=1 Tax=Pseudonocardia petroleophila TaxID=37331 RepID=A0A7G7MCG5_9PSEU|nr:SDR family oxidoreductase [Pseudonocardia petroleophila]QNG50476.1 SDR family oxidoreductase [Pseudonocardia petroleophila]
MRYLITGAASGIGAAVARLAAERSGAAEESSFVLVDRNAERLDELAGELTAQGAHCLPVVADLADAESPSKVVAAAITEFGGLDVVVSNAGAAAIGGLEQLDLEGFERTFAVNTRATWLLAKAAHPALRESRGALVATASISAQFPTPPMGAYSASKAALLMLVRQMALEWGPDGIRCNCVSPGPTDTGLTRAAFGDTASDAARENRAYRTGMIPLRRIGDPTDVAEAVLFLAGPHARQITGVDLPVDGGISLAIMPIAGGVPGYRPEPRPVGT